MLHIGDINLNILIVTTVISFLSVHTSILGNIIMKWLSRQTHRERELLDEKSSLKIEQSQLSMVEHFARHARLQRKINSIEEQLREIRSKKYVNDLSVRFGLTIVVSLLPGVMLLMLSVIYRRTPVFSVGKHLSLTPIGTFISFPNEASYVSVHFWILCCTAVARSI